MSIIYRQSDKNDIQILTQLRLDYIAEDRGNLSDEEKTVITKQLTSYYDSHIGNDFVAFLAEYQGKIVSVSFLVISEKPANLNFKTGITGTVLNVFTYSEYRKKGIATKLMKQLINEAKLRNLSYIELSATESGKPLYEKLGFAVRQSHYTEMRLRIV